MVNRYCSRNGTFFPSASVYNKFFLKILFIWKKFIVSPRGHLGKSPRLFRPQYRLNHIPILLFLICLCTGLLLPHPAYADDKQDSWQQMEGQDFIVYYRANVPQDFVQTTMDTSEDEFKRVANNLGVINHYWSLTKKVMIYIYSDQDDYVKNGGQAGWSHGVAFAQAKTIKLFPEASGFFDSLLPHELGHIIFRDYIGFTANVPLWFEEGIAIYQEKAKRLGSNKIVKEAIDNGQFIPLSKLSGMKLFKDSKDQVVDLFYTESASVVYYMITELGEQELLMLCNRLKENMRFEEAIHDVYLKNIDELNQAWVDYLQ
jgi:hypothetical protein